MATPEAIATEFVTFYYQEFDKGGAARAAMVNSVYTDHSILTFESSQHKGKALIAEKLGNLPFQEVKHQITTLDVQTTLHSGIMILVTGQLLVDKESNPMSFTQVFYLLKDGERWYPLNDLFKLILG